MKSRMKVCLVGLGYVGLTLALTLADCGIKVYGVDSNKKTIQRLKNNESTLSEKDVSKLLNLHLNKTFYPSESIPEEDFDYFIIGVGTPLNENKSPILDHIISSVDAIALKLKKDQTVILRSTVPVGTTKDVVIPILEKNTGFRPTRSARPFGR